MDSFSSCFSRNLLTPSGRGLLISVTYGRLSRSHVHLTLNPNMKFGL